MPSPTSPLRLAMWSGPRNISTALMRSWGNRPDTAVTDEPFYAHYLATTGKPPPGAAPATPPPGAAELTAAGEKDGRPVAPPLPGGVRGEKPVWYQKHMTHH